MNVTVRSDWRDIPLVKATDRIDVTSALSLENELLKLVDQGKTKIVFSFAETVYISSAGLRVFIAIAKKLKPMNGEIKLCAMSRGILKIFQLAGFDTIFAIFEEEEAALNSFQS